MRKHKGDVSVFAYMGKWQALDRVKPKFCNLMVSDVKILFRQFRLSLLQPLFNAKDWNYSYKSEKKVD